MMGMPGVTNTSQFRLFISNNSSSFWETRAQYLGPPVFEVDVPLESAIKQSLDSLLRFRPRQRGLKRSDGVEEPVGGWQRDLIDEILRGRDGTPVERGDS